MFFNFIPLIATIFQPIKNKFSKFDITQLKPENRNAFIEQNKNFIYNVTSKLCYKRLNWENDDELSIAMIAFNKSCDTYEEKRGNFYSYSKTVIKNSIYDYFRTTKNSPLLTFSNEEDDYDYIDTKKSLEEHELLKENELRAEEIKLFSKRIQDFGITFTSLVNNSPKHNDTRNRVLNLALICIRDKEVLRYVNEKHRLPIKIILSISNENRKFIDRWRIYIICILVILSSNEYTYLKSYLNIKAGDIND